MTDFDYGSLLGGELHYHIVAWNEQGKRFIFGTNGRMLSDKDDAERFKGCELQRYPIGRM